MVSSAPRSSEAIGVASCCGLKKTSNPSTSTVTIPEVGHRLLDVLFADTASVIGRAPAVRIWSDWTTPVDEGAVCPTEGDCDGDADGPLNRDVSTRLGTCDAAVRGVV